MILGCWALCRRMKTEWIFPAAALMMIMPFSWEYYSFVLQFPYYVPHIVITLLALALTFRYIDASSTRFVGNIAFAAGALLSFASGLGGARQVVICYLPLFLSASITFLRTLAKPRDDDGIDTRLYTRLFLMAAICLIAVLSGYFVNSRVLSRYYSFSRFDINFTNFQIDRFFAVLSGFLISFGYGSGPVDLLLLMKNAVSAFLFLLSLYCAVRGVRKSAGKDDLYFILSLFYLISLACFVLLFSFTDMFYEVRYNLPVIIIAAPVIGAGLNSMTEFSPLWRRAMLLLWVSVILVSGVGRAVVKELPKTDSDAERLVDFLDANDYTYGYATFWNANVLTELSDGRIEVHSWAHDYTPAVGDVNRPYRWLQLKKHDEIPTGKLFLLFSNYQIEPAYYSVDENGSCMWNLNDERIVFRSETHTIYAYDSYQEMIDEIYEKVDGG